MSTQLVKVERQTAKGFVVAEQAYGPVVFFNSNLITEKTMEIMRACLDDLMFEADGHGLYSIVIRDDGFPRGEITDDVGTRVRNTWRFYPESKSAICNFLECINSAIVDTQNPDAINIECFGIYGLIWKNILQGYFHEVHHAHSFLTDAEGKLWDALELESAELRAIEDAEEDAANAFAKAMMFKLAKSMDTEPEFAPEMLDIIDMVLVEEIDKINADVNASDKLKRWAMIQEYLRDNGGTYYNPRVPGTDTYTIHLKTFKSMMHHLSREAENDPSWNQDTTGIKVKMVQEPLKNEVAAVGTAPLFGTGEAVPVSDDDEVPDFEMINGASAPGFEGVAQFTAPVTQPVAQPAVNPTTQAWTPPWEQGAASAPINPTHGFNQNVVVPGQKAYPPFTLPAGMNPQDVINRLYVKIFMHIFRDCRYNPNNLVTPFELGGNICQPLILDPHEAMFVKEMKCITSNGHTTDGVVVKGEISGYMTDTAGKLPGYELTMATPDGNQAKRRFIPQNPNKMKKGTQEYSAPALLAQKGNCILWVMDPTLQKDNFKMRVYNGVIQNNVNGQWV